MSELQSIFSSTHFAFPYFYKFPGQASTERILYVTRESEMMLLFRRLTILIAALVIFLCGYYGGSIMGVVLGSGAINAVQMSAAVIALVFFLLGWWWVTTLWKHSIAIITTSRLTKFVYTTPWNRHNLSLPLEMIVDTGAYSKGFVQAVLRLGTFTARSSASSSGAATDDPDRINKKYFYIENISNFEDIHHYLHKVLLVYREDQSKLVNFRPFLPNLKGDARKEFMKSYPEYWS